MFEHSDPIAKTTAELGLMWQIMFSFKQTETQMLIEVAVWRIDGEDINSTYKLIVKCSAICGSSS